MLTGLYQPSFEKDSCGFGLIAQMDGKPSHWLVATAIASLTNLTHRGAVAADGKTGDGCGLLLKKPDAFLKAIAQDCGFSLTPLYAVGMVFLSLDTAIAAQARQVVEQELSKEGLSVAGWRDVPTDPSACGAEALKTLPHIAQVFVNAPADLSEADFERHLFIARRRAEKAVAACDEVFYLPSLSCRVISYKGLMMPDLLPAFYTDLKDERFESA
ncbi:MAG: glutamate synthase large subunit, partial [Pseudomonadota bacterium]